MCRCICCGKKMVPRIEGTIGESEEKQEKENNGKSLPWLLHEGWLQLFEDPETTKYETADVNLMYICPDDVQKLKAFLKVPQS